MFNKFMGIDPSYKGLGISTINIESKEINFYEFSTDVQDGAFGQIAPIAESFAKEIYGKSIFNNNMMIGMEIPPIQGFYAVKLWVLDSMLYNQINTMFNDIWLFNVPYLKFINKKYDGKNDTKTMMDKILSTFEDYGYTIDNSLKTKKGANRKLTSNQFDSFIYCIRMFVKYHMENGIHNDLVTEIVELNERFLEVKETRYGKNLDKEKKK